MKAQFVFIGGIHGAGKTSLCQKMTEELTEAAVFKQRHLIIEKGRELGLNTWEEIGPMHNLLIEDAAWLAINKASENKNEIILIDCHYAIRAKKALRINKNIVGSEYIPDLDLRFVSIIKKIFKIKFVLIKTNPAIAFERIKNRPEDIVDIDCSLDYLTKSEEIEQNYFTKMIEIFRVNNCEFSSINNNYDFGLSMENLKKLF